MLYIRFEYCIQMYTSVCFSLSLPISITMYTSGHGDLVKMATEYSENSSSVEMLWVFVDIFND